MMFRSIYLKTLYNLRWQLLGWTLAVGSISFVTMSFFNSFDQTGIEGIVNSVPDSFKALVGDIDDFKTVPGYIGQQIFGPNLYIVIIAAAIMLAIAVSASEEDNKRLQTLISLPVTRSAVYCQKWLAVVSVLAIICGSVAAGIYLALPFIDKSVDSQRVLESTIACFAMSASFASLTFAIAMFTGRKGLTIALASGYAVSSLLVSSLAPAVSGLAAIDTLSILHYYNNPQIMQHGLRLSHLLVLIVIILAVTTISWFQFRHRSIGTAN